MSNDTKKFFLFRHGETDWNKETRFQGHSNIHLNQTGIQQALELKALVTSLAPEVFITSDLVRAVETANLVNQDLKKPMFHTRALRETHLGDVEGLTRLEVKQKVGEAAMREWAEAHRTAYDFGFPGGETKRQVLDRVFAYLTDFALNTRADRVAVSTHGGVIKRLCHSLIDLPTDELPIKNCCLYEVAFQVTEKTWHYVRRLR